MIEGWYKSIRKGILQGGMGRICGAVEMIWRLICEIVDFRFQRFAAFCRYCIWEG